MKEPLHPKFLVGTQHPAFKGGVLSMLRVYLNWLQEYSGNQPSLAYRPFRTPGTPSSHKTPLISKESWEGLDAYVIRDKIPQIEALHYVGARKPWNQLIEKFDILQVVCGYALTGLPYALSGRRFVIWVATSLDGDKKARIQNEGTMRRLAQTFQMGRLRQMERYVLSRASWVFALSPHTKNELIERGASPNRISVLPYPIPLEKFGPCQTTKNEEPTILWVGRHEDARKGSRVLVSAFRMVLAEIPSARLLLVGDPAPSLLESLSPEEKGRIEFTGAKSPEEMPDFYRRAAIFAIPSEQEGLCIAALEAMACGLPVVSTRCGGPENIVLPEKTGLLVDKKDEHALAQALVRLLKDPLLRHRWGTNAKQIVTQEYTLKFFRTQLSDIYSRLWPEHFDLTGGRATI